MLSQSVTRNMDLRDASASKKQSIKVKNWSIKGGSSKHCKRANADRAKSISVCNSLHENGMWKWIFSSREEMYYSYTTASLLLDRLSWRNRTEIDSTKLRHKTNKYIQVKNELIFWGQLETSTTLDQIGFKETPWS